MPESTQHKLDRIRPPRVQITYDVETGGALQKKELPLVVGILADLAGQPETPGPRLKDSKFVEIDRDNFNQVLASIAPRLALAVDNKVAGEGKTNVELKFQSLDDFEPLAVVKQVEALRKLLDARQRLSDLLTKLDGNDNLDALLVDVAKKPEEILQLKSANLAAENGGQPNA
ncbi:MAG: type VI secretion system contractile sheath small subunit [Terriglobales bacterium]